MMRQIYQTDEGLHIDVRGLPPPEPMIEIVRLIKRDGIQPPIFAHLDRDPIYLYPELTEHGWQGELVSGEGEDVVVRLTRTTS